MPFDKDQLKMILHAINRWSQDIWVEIETRA